MKCPPRLHGGIARHRLEPPKVRFGLEPEGVGCVRPLQAESGRIARKWFGAPQAEALRYAVIAGMLLRVPAALLGMAHREAGRWNAARAYARVAAKAFHRWSKR